MNDILSEKHARIVENILLEELEVKREQLTPDAELEAHLGADSLLLVQLSMRLEDELEISVPEERWEHVKTVGQVFETVADLLPPLIRDRHESPRALD